MFINLCVINVGASVGNRSLVCDVFSYVDVIFIVDLPSTPAGRYIDGDIGDFVLMCDVDKCNVHAYIRRSLVSMFDVVWSDKIGLVLGMMSGGVKRHIGGVYLRPDMGSSAVEAALLPYTDCHIIVGDMNARHLRWGHMADGGNNNQGNAVNRVLADMDFMVPSIATHDGISVIDLCTFK